MGVKPASEGLPAPAPVAPDLQAVRQSVRSMRRARWIGIVFCLIQFALYKAPAGIQVPFPRLPLAVGVAACVLLVNILAVVAERRFSAQGLRWFRACALVADTTIIMGVTWLFGFDHTSALWALLIIPVLEGAVTAQLRGALWTWVGVTVGYALRDLAMEEIYGVPFEIDSVTYRMGIVLIVAWTAGALARSLTHQAGAHHDAQLESEQRARLLHGVAQTSRALLADQYGDAENVWEAIVDSAIAIGFDGASISLFAPDRATYRVMCSRGLPERYGADPLPAETGLAGMVISRDDTVTITDYGRLAQKTPELRDLQFGAAIGAAVRGSDGSVHAVLVAAYSQVGVITPSETEFIELLAAHAGTALANVERQVEKDEYEARLVELAYHDPLTRLPNRELFLDRLITAIDRSAATRADVAVLFCDLDRFKGVNDNLGHDAGDQLLSIVAARLASALRPGDIVARFGGDEFTVLVEDVTDVAHVVDLGNRLQAAVEPALMIGGREIFPSLSIGIAVSKAGDVAATDLLRDADVAMYRAKERGRHRVEVFHPDLSLGALRRFELEAELRHALEHEEFTLHYQPIMSLLDDTIVSVEALVRWSHPRRGFLSPAEFIPLAEESGLIVALGRWVLREACRQVSRWNAMAGTQPLAVAVNLSVKQLQQADLAAEVEAILLHTGLDPRRLVLEVTESSMVTDFTTVATQMSAISALGVRFALDDFGRGFTSLSYLKSLPINVLKVDRCFIDGLEHDTDNQAIVRSVAQLAHDLGMEVTAEGIETPAQLAQVTALSCDYGQGYLLHRPAPATDIEALRSLRGDVALPVVVPVQTPL